MSQACPENRSSLQLGSGSTAIHQSIIAGIIYDIALDITSCRNAIIVAVNIITKFLCDTDAETFEREWGRMRKRLRQYR